MKLSERECNLCANEGREQEGADWIVVCATSSCGGILADETEANPYIALLEDVVEIARKLRDNDPWYDLNNAIGELDALAKLEEKGVMNK